MPWDRATLQALPSAEVTHLHLLRHGKPDTGGQRRCYGHTDLPLSDEGRAQSAAMVAWALGHLPVPDRVLSSDLGRALVTARELAERFGVPLVIEPDLREQHMGDWEGRTWTALTESDIGTVRAFWTDYATIRPPGGENLLDLSDRVGVALDRHWGELRGGRTLVLAHAGVIRVLLCRALGLPVSDALRFAPVPGSHTWLQVAQAGTVVQTLGERPLASDPGIVAAALRVQRGQADHPPRLALAGSAGTGKSTLGRRLAADLDVPYIPEGMRERLEAGLNIHALGPGGFQRLFMELWNEKVDREDQAIVEHGGFVSDRSPWDYAVFRLLYRFTRNVDEVDRFYESVRARTNLLDRLIVLPWGTIPLQADGIRTANPWTQRLFQSSLEGLVTREVSGEVAAFMPPLHDLESRVAWVMDLITESGSRHGDKLRI